MLVAYVALLYGRFYYFEPQSSMPTFLAYTGSLWVVLIVVVGAEEEQSGG